VSGPHGLTVYTTLDLNVEHMRQSPRESVHASFLLRALGETAGAVASSPETLEYLIDTLTEMTASYQITFTDEQTTRAELMDYLSFARSLGLDAKGPTFAELQPLLPMRGADDFGKMSATYNVRYTGAALELLLRRTFPNVEDIRHFMRQILLASYIDRPFSAEMGRAFSTPGLCELWATQGGPAFTNRLSSVEFSPISSPIAGLQPRAKAVIQPGLQINVLSTLFGIQDHLIEAMQALFTLMRTPGGLSPAVFEQKLDGFGDALGEFNRFSQFDDRTQGVNTTFFVFDRLIELYGGNASMRAASLELTSEVNGQTLKKVFVA
jgi:hypothetical protein